MTALDGVEKEGAVDRHSDDEPRTEDANGIITTTGRGPTAEDDDNDDDAPRRDSQHATHPIAKTDTNISIAETLSLPHEIIFVGLVCTAQFFTQVSLGQTIAIINTIGADFGLQDEPGQLSWFIAGYSLTVGTFILVSGRLGDMFGYKRMLLLGLGWYALWTLIAGLAVYSSHVLFIFARVMTGIGPAFCLPNGLAIFGATYRPGRRKAMVFSLFGACAPGGAVVGSVFASLFRLAWWPWTFWSTAIAAVGVLVAGYFFIPDPPASHHATAERRTMRELLREVDLLGALVGIAALVLFNFAWNQAPISGWSAPSVITTLVLGLVLFGVFFYIELRVSSAPLIPFHALSGDVPFVLAAVSCGWACFGIWVFYAWQTLETLMGYSPLLASAAFVPVSISGAAAAVCTGMMLHRAGPPVVMTIALTSFAVGEVLLATARVGQVYWANIFVMMLITPWGMDMSFPAATLILSNAVEAKHQGIAASLVATVVNYSISLGLGFAGTVEVHVNNGGKTFEDVQKGFRGAEYMGIGLAVLGMAVCAAFLIRTHAKAGKARGDSKTETA